MDIRASVSASLEALVSTYRGFHRGHETLDQLFTLTRTLEGTWEVAQPVYMCFMDLERAFDHVPQDTWRVVLRKYGVCYGLQKLGKKLESEK